ncbi:MAG: Omp28-related outer membrane protein [Saprospirales bacterium]|nr:Omp28-related outer membrane protein [Saprospirales bacterium]
MGTTTAQSSQYFPIPARPGNILGTNDDQCNCNKSADLVKFPVIDLTGRTNVWLLFDLYFLKGTVSGKTETLKVVASTDGGTTWTDLVNIAGGSGWRSPYGVNASAYAGQAAVQFAFLYNDAGDWLYGAMIDNVKIVEGDDVIRATVGNVTAGKTVDAVPRLIYGYTKMIPGEQIALRGALSNPGFPPITSYDVKVTYASEVITKSFINLNIGIGGSHTFSFDVPDAVESGDNAYTIEIFNVNGVGDADPSDNKTVFTVEGITPHPGRKVVVEEGTGTWCGWCPRGAVMMDYMATLYPDNVIPIAVHNSSSDPMRNATYDNGMGTLISGYPSGLVDREADIDPIDFERYALEHMAQAPKILVSHSAAWDPATRKVNVTSALNFQEEMNGNYRIAVVYTEEGVTGTASGYAQANYYAGGSAGPMGGYETLPSTVPAANMTYDHVARTIVGGFSGKAGSVPANNPAGTVMFYESVYTVNAAYNIDNMHVITMVIDQDTKQIINAESTAIPFVSTGAPTLSEDAVSISLFPNPVQDEATLTIRVKATTDVQIRVVDAFGRIVIERHYDDISDKQFLPFRAGNLANGMYTLVATAQGRSVSKPFVVAH